MAQSDEFQDDLDDFGGDDDSDVLSVKVRCPGPHDGKLIEEVFKTDPAFVDNLLATSPPDLITVQLLEELIASKPAFQFSEQSLERVYRGAGLRLFRPNTVFAFGRYKGWKMVEIFIKDPEYLELCMYSICDFAVDSKSMCALKENNPQYRLSYGIDAMRERVNAQVRKRIEGSMPQCDTTLEDNMDAYGYDGPPEGFDDWRDANGF